MDKQRLKKGRMFGLENASKNAGNIGEEAETRGKA